LTDFGHLKASKRTNHAGAMANSQLTFYLGCSMQAGHVDWRIRFADPHQPVLMPGTKIHIFV
jgi:hypothetical protein